jgi:hypothetical protein
LLTTASTAKKVFVRQNLKIGSFAPLSVEPLRNLALGHHRLRQQEKPCLNAVYWNHVMIADTTHAKTLLAYITLMKTG